EEIGIEVHRRLEPARRVEAYGNRRGLFPPEIRVHAQRLRHVDVAGDVHRPERDGLQRLLGPLTQYRRRPEADFLAYRRVLRGTRRITLRTDDIVERRGQVRIGEPIRHDAIYHLSRSLLPAPCSLDAHNRPDPDARLVRGPEVELVGRRRLLLRRDDATDGGRI